jgi:DNA topoisomerase-3
VGLLHNRQKPGGTRYLGGVDVEMARALVLAEKPSVGMDIARVLQCNKKGNGFMEGDKYIVTWAFGHLVTLADPEVYDQKYKSWVLEDLPMLPSSLKLVVMKKTGKQFNTIKGLLNRKDVSEIVIATDSGREGELVARWIIEKAMVSKPIKRLWISSVTDKAIKEGFSRLKDGKAYENLYASAVARAAADWYVGINATRALTCKFNAQLSCGRVQTPTLAIIAQREEEIKNFRPRTYYRIIAKSNDMILTWLDDKNNSSRIFDEDKCDKIIASIQGKNAKVVDIDKKYKKKYSPQLYDLTELQRDANRMFDLSAKETLSILQSLYERHKILTYPRTDSRYISTDIVDTLSDRIKACSVGPYSTLAQVVLKNTIKANKHFVDNSKVSDHHAIIPTEQVPIIASLNDKERRIYDLVIKRFFAVLYPPYEYEHTTVKAKIADELFIARGSIVKAKGWKTVYENDWIDNDSEDDLLDQMLPNINNGDIINILGIEKTEEQTKPPVPFNEGTLLSAMENPVKYMEGNDKSLIKTLGETGGLGTVATRADIIEKLFNNFLIEKKGKEIFITSKGRQLLDLVPEALKSPALTGKWEQKLELIARGELKDNTFINEVKNYAKEVVDEIKNSEGTFRHDNLTRTKCPECGEYMLEVKGKKGKMLICKDRECGFRKKLSQFTNARCPQCHKKMELWGEGESQTFVCSCGYREKLSSHNKRKKEGTDKASKQDINKYLKKNNDKPVNTALADALSKIKLD